jgi:hypothetical protein
MVISNYYYNYYKNMQATRVKVSFAKPIDSQEFQNFSHDNIWVKSYARTWSKELPQQQVDLEALVNAFMNFTLHPTIDMIRKGICSPGTKLTFEGSLDSLPHSEESSKILGTIAKFERQDNIFTLEFGWYQEELYQENIEDNMGAKITHVDLETLFLVPFQSHGFFTHVQHCYHIKLHS